MSNTSCDAAGYVSDRSLGAGATTLHRSYTYDPITGRLSSLKASSASGLLQDESISYDLLGNVRRTTDGITGQRSCSDYDDLSRLAHAWTSDSDCTDAAAPHDTSPVSYDLTYHLVPPARSSG
ncbi:MAG: hypothetical protein ABR549_06570 [Mycobacteriales bacterium]